MRTNNYWDEIVLRGAELGRLNEIKKALAKGADINTTGVGEWGVLHSAVSIKRDDIVKFLLSQPGINVNIRDYHGNTPLHTAADSGYTEIVKLLLAKGADVNLTNREGKTPLYESISTPHDIELIPLFVKHGANVNARRKEDGCTVIHTAAWAGKVSTYKLLLELGANPNLKSYRVVGYEDGEEVITEPYTAKEIYRELHPEKIKEFEAAERGVEAKRSEYKSESLATVGSERRRLDSAEINFEADEKEVEAKRSGYRSKSLPIVGFKRRRLDSEEIDFEVAEREVETKRKADRFESLLTVGSKRKRPSNFVETVENSRNSRVEKEADDSSPEKLSINSQRGIGERWVASEVERRKLNGEFGNSADNKEEQKPVVRGF
ncbi:ankyrin repeat domain-containing protein [Holosporaceae bacterium 'Namur']|nr:ankyrin repeat domain-containing protein [Holosporaceae bacterium 'Namur']